MRRIKSDFVLVPERYKDKKKKVYPRRQPLSEEELEERKERYWGDGYNARRRERYARDREYRERAKATSREVYAKKVENAIELTTERILKREESVSRACPVRTVLKGDAVFVIPTMNLDELSALLRRSKQTIQRWIKTDLLPAPILQSFVGGKAHQYVYSKEEALCIRDAVCCDKSLRGSRVYYGKKCPDVTDKLFADIDKIRRKKDGKRK